MNQAPLQLDTPAAAPVDRTGFDIGWDHAHHGLVPPGDLLQAGAAVGQGWTAGRAVFGRRTLTSSRHTRLWLQLRLHAWQHGIAFDTVQVTPNHLAQIDSPLCPVRRCRLGGAPGQPDAAVVERLNPQAGYAAGNLAVMSLAAAQARTDVDVAQAQRRARSAEVTGEPVQGLDAAAWWRLAALRAFATPLAFAEAARLPLAVMPPNRTRLLNAAQGLQALVTRCFATPGWSARCRALAQMLPQHTLRHDFNLFVGAMAPRVLEAGSEPASLRRALEDAWLQERVQRRWQHLVLSLGEAATEALLERAAQAGLAGVRVVCHGAAQATEGWGLPTPTRPQRVLRDRGMVLVQGAKAPRPAPALNPAARPAAHPETAPAPAARATHA